MEDKKKEKYICHECESKKIKTEFNNYRNLEKHQWTWHPSNSIERAWAKHAREGFMNWTGSSYYESYGPYY